MSDPRLNEVKVPRSVCVEDVESALSVLDGRWKMLIVANLYGNRELRFSELYRAIPKISQKVLAQQLRDLERSSVVARKVYSDIPPKVEYALTEAGRGLGPVFLALLDWEKLRRKLTTCDLSP